MTKPDRRESTDRVKADKPGLYVCVREVMVDGAWRRNEVVCRNPAYGYLQLDTWEQELRAGTKIVRIAGAERASALRHARQRA